MTWLTTRPAAILLRGDIIHVENHDRTAYVPWGVVLDVRQATCPDLREILEWASPTWQEAAQYVAVHVWRVAHGKNQTHLLTKTQVLDVLPAPVFREEEL